VGRVAALTAARPRLAPRPVDLECLGVPKLDPRLCLIYQPSRSERLPADDPVRVLLDSIRRVWPSLAEPSPGADAGGAPPPAGGHPLQLVGIPSSWWPGPMPGGHPLQLVGMPSSWWPGPMPGGHPLQLVARVAVLPLHWSGLLRPLAPGRGPVCGGPAQPDPLGLSEAQSPQNAPRRHGLNGLSRNGARQIQRAAAVLQDELGRLSFWTVTLPDETIRAMVAADLWPAFQTRVRDLLVRALKNRGMPARVVGVVELHPSRSMRERVPLPHLHVIFHGSRRKWGGWVLEPADLDRIIRDAVRYVGLPAPDVRSAGNIQPVRRNCGAYLAKYMTKSRQSNWLKQVPGNLPRVWWFWSAELRAQVLDLVLPVCWSFASWLHRLPEDRLEGIGAARVRLEIPDSRAPATWCVRFSSDSSLWRAQKLWAADEDSLKVWCPALF